MKYHIKSLEKAVDDDLVVLGLQTQYENATDDEELEQMMETVGEHIFKQTSCCHDAGGYCSHGLPDPHLE